MVAATARWRVVHRRPDAAFKHGGRHFCACVVEESLGMISFGAGLGPLISWQPDHK